MTDTASGEVADHAQQAATALRRLNRLIADARTAEQTPDPEKVAFYQHVLHSAVVLGVQATAAPRPAPNTSPRSAATPPPPAGKASTPSTPLSRPPPATPWIPAPA